LGKDYPIIYVGHADLVDDNNGNWYIVMLASRRCEGYCGLGRETFLAKVIWEEGWPVVNPGIGKLEAVVELPFEGVDVLRKRVQSLKNFSDVSYDVVILRNADRSFYDTKDGILTIKYLPVTMKDLDSPAYLGFRQLDYSYEAILEIAVSPLADTEEVGLVILQSNAYHVRFLVKKSDKAMDGIVIQLVKCIQGTDHILFELEPEQLKASACNTLKLKTISQGQQADFTVFVDDIEIPLLKCGDIHELSTEVAGGFVGNTIGVYASSNGMKSNNKVQIIDFTVSYPS
jgi:alpha-N-arabinofuranosidase